MPEIIATMSEIFKNGEDFEFKKVDYSTQKISTEMKRVKEIQNDIRKSADADLTSIKHINFDI
ncbi:MAG: hypothetical protein JWP78_2068 [Mucilaginibacter sp.]|nr:hypothetical protein [Mucilaginibacter sp.]